MSLWLFQKAVDVAQGSASIAGKANWSRGMFRLWIVFSVIWIALISGSLDPVSKIGPARTPYRHNVTSPPRPVLELTDLDTIEGLSNSSTRLAGYLDQYPDDAAAIRSAYPKSLSASDPNSKVALFIAEQIRDSIRKKRAEAVVEIVQWAVYGLGVPLGFFALGLAIRWVLRGFAS